MPYPSLSHLLHTLTGLQAQIWAQRSIPLSSKLFRGLATVASQRPLRPTHPPHRPEVLLLPLTVGCCPLLGGRGVSVGPILSSSASDIFCDNENGPNFLFHNQGDGTFVDAAASAGECGPRPGSLTAPDPRTLASRRPGPGSMPTVQRNIVCHLPFCIPQGSGHRGNVLLGRGGAWNS